MRKARHSKSASKMKDMLARYTNLDMARALGAYLDAEGDLDQAHRQLGRKIAKSVLRYWEREYHWPVYLEREKRRLFERQLDKSVERKELALRILDNTMKRIALWIIGRAEDSIDPIPPRSMEGAVESLVEVVRLIREITGEDRKQEERDAAAADPFQFARRAILDAPRETGGRVSFSLDDFEGRPR